MRIAIGTDHRGFALKETLKQVAVFGDCMVNWLDVGCKDATRTDYPAYGFAVVKAVRTHAVAAGVLLCGTGIGMSIIANRFAGVYAALAWNETIARLAKEDDNANVLVLPADYLSEQEAHACITAWLMASFKEGRYKDRLLAIEQYSKKGGT